MCLLNIECVLFNLYHNNINNNNNNKNNNNNNNNNSSSSSSSSSSTSSSSSSSSSKRDKNNDINNNHNIITNSISLFNSISSIGPQFTNLKINVKLAETHVEIFIEYRDKLNIPASNELESLVCKNVKSVV